jgi:hypothetical protein
MKLSENRLEKIIPKISPKGIDYRAGRIVRLLAKGPQRTGIIAHTCSVGNISDVVAKDINPKLLEYGLYIACTKPPQAIINKFGQIAGDHIWSFYQVAANDDEYEQGSSVDDWEKQLEEVLKLPEIDSELGLGSG